MRLRCHLRQLRDGVSIREMADRTGIDKGYLSRYERGMEIPRDHHVQALESAYGAPARDWYAPHVWLELHRDQEPVG